MSHVSRRLPVGAEIQSNGDTHFRVWAPDPRRVTLRIQRARGGWAELPMERDAEGYWTCSAPGAGDGTRYVYRLDGEDAADPASRWQPEGPFGPSAVVDPCRFRWTDGAWGGVQLRGQVLYEMHVGTFTPEGTWERAAARLRQLKELGITTVEVMPVSDFPGAFGWGYDGVFPYAPTRLYGSPDAFRAFVDRAHALGLGVVLDVVYNHLGPSGCVFSRYARAYFTKRYANEWGAALNFDGEDSGPVREYFTCNAQYWIDEFHLDGLRLDATQSIHDSSPEHIIAAIARATRTAARERSIILITENEPQQVRMLRPLEAGGYGLDAAWNDDFHHSALVALTGRTEAYFADHRGAPQEFISAAKYGYLFQGQWYGWQKQPRGSSARGIAPAAFVNFTENHDQLANSANGTRVHQRTSPARYRAMTALLLLLPGTPMLFQGQEFGASAPFLYFADHHPELAAAVEEGRLAFVGQFQSLASEEMQRQIPSPHARATYERCVLDWREWDAHPRERKLHGDLIALRAATPAFTPAGPGFVDGTVIGPDAFALRYFADAAAGERLLIVNLGRDVVRGSVPDPLVAPPAGHRWQLAWSSEAPEYGGCGTPEIMKDGWRIPGEAAVVFRPEQQDGGSST